MTVAKKKTAQAVLKTFKAITTPMQPAAAPARSEPYNFELNAGKKRKTCARNIPPKRNGIKKMPQYKKMSAPGVFRSTLRAMITENVIVNEQRPANNEKEQNGEPSYGM